ncbi:MAG: diaminopimelate epimerase [Methylotenera sp.]|nr:diaminopimelate epimerase [Oligoflexia bacterium]
MPFLKMQALGNDFVLVDQLKAQPGAPTEVTADVARRMGDRKFGVGFDQLLLLKPAKDAANHARMDIFNTDGSIAEMCGNGIRAAALYLYRYGSKPRQKTYSIETLGGIKHIELKNEREILVDMGQTQVQVATQTVTAHDKTFEYHAVDMGNPHAVIFVPDVASFDVEKFGSVIEKGPQFPSRTNVEFVEVLNPHEIRLRVWERGAGLTLACGTGACAAAVAALALEKVRNPVTVHLPGGALKITWKGAEKSAAQGLQSSVWMEGPAEEVFRGEFFI